MLTSRLLPYARAEGLASAFVQNDASFDQAGRVATISALGALAALWRTEGPRGLVAGVLGGVSACVLAGLARRRVGGFTGDVLGAVAVVVEVVALSVLAR